MDGVRYRRYISPPPERLNRVFSIALIIAEPYKTEINRVYDLYKNPGLWQRY